MCDCKQRIVYHIFSDNYDRWLTNLKDANKLFTKLKHEGRENIRIHKTLDCECGDSIDEFDCIRTLGEWPQ